MLILEYVMLWLHRYGCDYVIALKAILIEIEKENMNYNLFPDLPAEGAWFKSLPYLCYVLI